VISSCVLVVVAACGGCRSDAVRAEAEPGGVRLTGCSSDVRFARTASRWGAVCDVKRRIEPLPDVALHCEESLVLTLLEDDLRPALPRSLRVARGACRSVWRHGVVATAGGLAVAYADGPGRTLVTSYDHASGTLRPPRPVLEDLVATDTLLQRHAVVAWRDGAVLLLTRRPGALRLLALAPDGGGTPPSVVTVPLAAPDAVASIAAARLDRTTVLAWMEEGAADVGALRKGEVRFAFARPGQPIGPAVTVMTITGDDLMMVTLAAVARGDETWLFVARGHELWRQRIHAAGLASGAPELVAREDQVISSLAVVADPPTDTCLLHYGSKLAGCEPGSAVRGDGGNSSLACQGGACLRVHGDGRIRRGLP
jgi:hypothetical protein